MLVAPMDRSDPFAQARARQALRSAGLDDETDLTRASSTRNEVFVGDEFVVRVNRHPNQRLRREAELCNYLPDEPWAPQVVAYGGKLGADYLIVRRLPGQPLARSWPLMSTAQRRSAISQLCLAITQLQLTPTPVTIPQIDNLPYLIDPRCVSPIVPLLMALEDLKRAGWDNGIINAAENLANDIGDALADYDRRQLIHGDLTFENVLWDGVHLTGVLDFEWCRGAPIDMELDVLLRMAAFPFAHVAPDLESISRAEDYVELPVWLAEFRPALFSHPRLIERLVLYSMAFDAQELTTLTPTDRGTLGRLHPLSRLGELVTDGGHLATVLDRVGVPL